GTSPNRVSVARDHANLVEASVIGRGGIIFQRGFAAGVVRDLCERMIQLGTRNALRKQHPAAAPVVCKTPVHSHVYGVAPAKAAVAAVRTACLRETVREGSGLRSLFTDAEAIDQDLRLAKTLIDFVLHCETVRIQAVRDEKNRALVMPTVADLDH